MLPILPDLSPLTAAARYEHYSDFGSTTTYKVSARWEPIRNYALRGTISTGGRACGPGGGARRRGLSSAPTRGSLAPRLRGRQGRPSTVIT